MSETSLDNTMHHIAQAAITNLLSTHLRQLDELMEVVGEDLSSADLAAIKDYGKAGHRLAQTLNAEGVE